LININLNGSEISVQEGKTILEICVDNGVSIPTFCYDERLKAEGSCRICIVEVEGAPKPLPSCSTIAAPNMVIRTHSPRIIKLRKQLLEAMLSNHDISCLQCEKAGKCLLQDYACEYGVDTEKLKGRKKASDHVTSNKFFYLDQSKCILCGKCARVCSQLQGNSVWAMSNRGFETEVTTPFGIDMEEVGCVHCGNCVSGCPVGALMPKTGQKFRTWETRKVRTTCAYCGVGCQLDLLVKDDRVVGAEPAAGKSNEGLLCVKGKFAFDFINHPDRLTQPLVRGEDGSLHPASWDEALSLVAAKTKQIIDESGADAIAGLSSARVTNEENYLFMKYMRAAVGTNNVDHCARL
jgi:formate dehydrogenase major subunit